MMDYQLTKGMSTSVIAVIARVVMVVMVYVSINPALVLPLTMVDATIANTPDTLSSIA
jgi:hypothetical protein